MKQYSKVITTAADALVRDFAPGEIVPWEWIEMQTGVRKPRAEDHVTVAQMRTAEWKWWTHAKKPLRDYVAQFHKIKLTTVVNKGFRVE